MEAAGRIRPQALRIFAFDDLAETKEGIRQGKIDSTIVQEPRKMGYEAVSLLSGYFAGNTPQPQHFTAISLLDKSAAGETSP
jgi:ribose transport system substrate-binding protein